MSDKNKTFAEAGHCYCYTLEENGWRNHGMVPDNNRGPFIAEYKLRGAKWVCFIPFCWTYRPNVMSDSEIFSYADCIH